MSLLNQTLIAAWKKPTGVLQFYYSCTKAGGMGRWAMGLGFTKKSKGANDLLTIPIPVELKERYKKVQAEMNHKEIKETLHSFLRIRIKELLDEAEKKLSQVG